jgi:hypothetical protein
MRESKNRGVRLEQKIMDLGAFDPAILLGAHLVTASALLDLVSERWLRQLASACRSAGAAGLFALTYNGRSECEPAEPEDERIRELFNAHQRRSDKGFGVAAGPDAVAKAIDAFHASGYNVRHEASDWILRPEMQTLQNTLIDGWANAASELAPEDASVIADWRQRRQVHVKAGRSRIIVGHDDIWATLTHL